MKTKRVAFGMTEDLMKRFKANRSKEEKATGYSVTLIELFQKMLDKWEGKKS